MFGLTYLSNRDQIFLQQLEESLTKARTPKDRDTLLFEIEKVRSKAKNYKDCDLPEAEELKSQLLNKMNLLSNIGKSVEPFKIYLRDLDFHIQTLQLKNRIEEENKMPRPSEAPNLKDKSPTVTSVRKERKRKEIFGNSRWVINFEDEPDATN
jgi:hypothetical protein